MRKTIASQIAFFQVDSFMGGKARILLDFLKVDSCQAGLLPVVGWLMGVHQQKVREQAEKKASITDALGLTGFPLFSLAVCTSLFDFVSGARCFFARRSRGKPAWPKGAWIVAVSHRHIVDSA